MYKEKLEGKTHEGITGENGEKEKKLTGEDLKITEKEREERIEVVKM